VINLYCNRDINQDFGGEIVSKVKNFELEQEGGDRCLENFLLQFIDGKENSLYSKCGITHRQLGTDFRLGSLLIPKSGFVQLQQRRASLY
jgi:hypothetical protein